MSIEVSRLTFLASGSGECGLAPAWLSQSTMKRDGHRTSRRNCATLACRARPTSSSAETSAEDLIIRRENDAAASSANARLVSEPDKDWVSWSPNRYGGVFPMDGRRRQRPALRGPCLTRWVRAMGTRPKRSDDRGHLVGHDVDQRSFRHRWIGGPWGDPHLHPTRPLSPWGMGQLDPHHGGPPDTTWTSSGDLSSLLAGERQSIQPQHCQS